MSPGTALILADVRGLARRSGLHPDLVRRLIAKLDIPVAESATYRDRTLWGAVVEHLRVTGGSGRQALLRHFKREDPNDLAAVLKDLVSTGCVSSTGRFR